MTNISLTKYEILTPLLISEKDYKSEKDFLFMKNIFKECIVLG